VALAQSDRRHVVARLRAARFGRDDTGVPSEDGIDPSRLTKKQCRREDGGTTAARGLARVTDTAIRAKLKVRFAPAFLSFLPLVWGDYWIIGLDDGYRWAVVGAPNREYLWILPRTPQLDD
jgi:apolipoprotein D and lipocalin family protein